MKLFLSVSAACLCLAATPVLAQSNTTTTVDPAAGTTTTTTETVKRDHGGTAPGAVGGAVAGAVVAGPVGAVVGGIAGATVGHTVAPPSRVRTYVTTQTVDPVSYSGHVEVGHTVDGEVTWRTVPDYPKYSWAHLNGQRVVIDNDTHKVVAIY